MRSEIDKVWTAKKLIVAVAAGAALAGSVWADEGECHKAPAGEKRPPQFVAHPIPLVNGAGWALSGCFPGQPGTEGGQAQDLNVGAALVCNPPPTPEESRELAEKEPKCGTPEGRRDFALRARVNYLKDKIQRWRQGKYQVAGHVIVNGAAWMMENVEFKALETQGDKPRTCVVGPNPAAQAWRPWHLNFRPLSISARLRPAGSAPGAATEGSININVTRPPNQPLTMKGMLKFDRAANAQMVLGHVAHGLGGAARPPWHRHCKKGREEEGELEEGGGAPAEDEKRAEDEQKKKVEENKKEQDKGNNGVGNGVDPAPPGNPKENDGAGTSPGNPGNKGGDTVKKDRYGRPVK